MLISNGIFHTGGFAYYLHKPYTNWFPPVNGKQPLSLHGDNSVLTCLAFKRFFFYAGFWQGARGHGKAEKRALNALQSRVKNLRSA